MSKQQYAWMLGLVVAWRQRVADDNQDDPRPLLQSVYARAGTFENPPTRSANDLAALLIAVVLILLLAYVNSRAKVRVPGSFLREIRGGAIWRGVTAETAWLQAALILAPLLPRCQNDHLPT